MNRSWAILRAMMTKEMRVLLREKRVAAVSAILLFGLFLFTSFLVVGSLEGHDHPHRSAILPSAPYFQSDGVQPVQKGSRPSSADDAPNPSRTPRPESPNARHVWAPWTVVALVGYLSFPIVGMFGVILTVSAFTGERESRTAELLLAAPLSDRRLFVLKVLSALTPSVAIAYGVLAPLGLIGSAVIRPGLPSALIGDVDLGILASLPVPFAVGSIVVATTMLASVRAKTTAGAALLFSALGMVMGGGSFTLLLWPESAQPILDGVGALLGLPFGIAYLCLTMIVFSVAAGLFAVGYLLFDRERMVT